VSATIRDKEAAEKALEKENQKRRITGVLDPITTELQYFESRENLVERIDNMFTNVDEDGSGGLSFSEFKHGLLNFGDTIKIHITIEDFEQFTDNGRFLTDGEFNQSQFQDMMQVEFTRFCNRLIANRVKESTNTEFNTEVLMLKMIEMNILKSLVEVSNPLGGNGAGGVEINPKLALEAVNDALKKLEAKSENILVDKLSEMEQRVLRLLERAND